MPLITDADGAKFCKNQIMNIFLGYRHDLSFRQKNIFILLLFFLLFLTPGKLSSAPLIGSKPLFYDAVKFRHAIVSAKTVKPKDSVRAVIVPHHLLAGGIAAEMLKIASGRSIGTIAIIGPNHKNAGGRKVLASGADFETVFGKAESDFQLAKSLNKFFGQEASDESFGNEHSIGAVVPYVKYYFPRAKILPVILSSNAGEKEAEKLAGWLKRNLPEDSLVVLSADFSHYLNKIRASASDKISEEQIKNPNIKKIIQFNNDFIDTPAGLATMALYVRTNNIKPQIIRHNFSDDFSKNKTDSTTSYFGVVFE
jgi:MEMO1 family protein